VRKQIQQSTDTDDVSCKSQFPSKPLRPRSIQSSDCQTTPAAGLRGSGEGAFWNVGTNGYAWSSSSFAGQNPHCAGYLDIHATNVNPLNWTNRANAFPVRCVQHLPGGRYAPGRVCARKTAFRP